MKISQVFHALQYLSPAQPLLLVGPPGVGKSDLLAQYCDQKGWDLIVEHPVIAEPIDYRGLPIVAGAERDRARWLPIGNLARIVAPDCPPTLVALEDLGQADDSVQKACMQFLLARRLGDFAIAPQVVFAATTNRSEDLAGVRHVLSSLVNRTMVVEVVADAGDWADWAISKPDISPLMPAYARFRPDLFAGEVPTGIEAWCSPRSFAAAGRLYARNREGTELLGGLVGRATALDFLAFAEVAERLPNVRDVLRNPRKWKVPAQDPGLVHAMLCMAARCGDDPDGIFGLADRLADTGNLEWAVVLVSDAVGVTPELKAEPVFRKWALKNHQELL